MNCFVFFFSSRRRHTRSLCDWSSDVCSSDLRQKLEKFPWTERLPFSRPPIVETIEPTMVTSIVDPNNLLRNAQDITPMALAYRSEERRVGKECRSSGTRYH